MRWARPEGVHLTLKFLGDIEASAVDAISRAMARAAQGVAPLELALAGTGAFPTARDPRVLWVGLKGDVESLARLQGRLDAELAPLGFPKEARAFSPHLTLGRVRDGAARGERQRIGDAIATARLPNEARWRADSLSLMRSTLAPAGAIYQRIAQIGLTPPLPGGGAR